MKNFKEEVFNIVRKIPKGKVLTYKEVAIKVGSPKAYRAVGNILSKNNDPKIPCHRVVRGDGTMGGYNGLLNNRKKVEILKKEGVRLKV
jgi:O-6-methylguanine DNA methyltransferase